MQRAHALLIVAAASLAACSAKETKTDTTTPAQAGTPATPVASASKATFDPATHVVVLHAKDFSFDAPDSITAGWTSFHLVNDGPQLHHAQLVRIDSGKTFADFEAAFKNPGPPPKWAVLVGGPNAPAPSAESDASFNLTPGQYAIVCFVDVPDHVPHVAKGMMRGLKVVASTTPAAPEPAADVTIALSDYAFAVQGKLTAGKHTIKITNKGPQDHEIEIVKLAEGKTAKDVIAWIGKPEGPPPGMPMGGMAGAVNGTSGYVTADFTPGTYAFLCFVPDVKDQKTHAEHGMVKEVVVK